MLLEMHAHTSRYSKCSVIDPVTLVRQTADKGLQGLILTEHHHLWSADELRRLKTESEVEYHFLLFSGQEVDTDFGHVLVYGADVSITEKTPLRTLRERFPQAALVWAHPFRKGRMPSAQELTQPLFNALEIFSLNHTPKENFTGLKRWHEYKFTAVSGSDVHATGMPGTFPTHFDHYVNSIQGVADEIRAGRCRPFFKEIPRAGSDMTVTEITIGTKGSNELRQRIIVKNFTDPGKWEKAKESARLTETLCENGFRSGLYRVPKLIDTNEQERMLIEEGQRGRNLYDLLSTVHPETGTRYYALAARWLARFHKLRLRFSGLEALEGRETQRFASYVNSFNQSNNPHAAIVREITDFVQCKERELIAGGQGSFLQVHGDYHPKNIIIGQDRIQDPGTVYISVIDFNNSMLFAPAFDVGYFLSQFRSQFLRMPEILKEYGDGYFIEQYLDEAAMPASEEFLAQVKLFRVRANLSIASYLIRVGKGESREMTDLLANAEQLFRELGGR